MQLFGISGSTSEYDVERYVRDALSITNMLSPMDKTLIRIGQNTLENFKSTQIQIKSALVDYASLALPEFNMEILLRTAMGEQERIIDLGTYAQKNIRLFLYDMTLGLHRRCKVEGVTYFGLVLTILLRNLQK